MSLHDSQLIMKYYLVLLLLLFVSLSAQADDSNTTLALVVSTQALSAFEVVAPIIITIVAFFVILRMARIAPISEAMRQKMGYDYDDPDAR
jgi:hypothetical protein